MKRYKDLYPQITRFENLYWAYREARKGKRDLPAAASFEFNMEGDLFGLRRYAERE